ncbi:MAG TPA: hypothetical protein VEU62_11685 [Bryobacterales bacterium]|nr:hypothetical protein [Bryobacterales bacterium]
MYDPTTEVTVKGTIDDVQQMAHGRRMMGTHVMLKTDAGTLDVHLGPSSFLSKKGFTLAKGDQIEVTGSKVKYSGADALIAREVKKGDKTLTLRDKNGVPEWAGTGRRPTD